MRNLSLTFATVLFAASTACGDEPVVTARPIPLTRPEMKQLLEDMKSRGERIPLPPVTDEERAQLGERGGGYEARLRHHYLPPGEPSGFGFGRARSTPSAPATGAPAPPRDFTRNSDERMTLSYPFKTRLFWIVSRTNNCQYCLGHQEQKLSATGMTDDEIAALDFDWQLYSPAEQAAFAYARKLTYEPHRLGDDDINKLRPFYTDSQILEMTMSVAFNNAINRWKEGTGVPQSQSGISFFRRNDKGFPADRPLPIESFLTPTSPQFQSTVTRVAVYKIDDVTGQPTRLAMSNRPPLESRDEVEAALAAARQRKPRLPLLSEEEARQALGDAAPDGVLLNWVRLFATFPNEARGRIRSTQSLEEARGELTPLLKAQVSWIIARQHRAWYATGLLQKRLRDLGQSDDQIYALDGAWSEFTPAEQSLFKFARKLAATPIALTDADVAESLELTSPHHVVQLINFVTGRAYFDRVTEAAGLPLEQ